MPLLPRVAAVADGLPLTLIVLAPLLDKKARHGWSGWVSVEWEKKWHPELADPEVAFPQHAELLRRYMGELGAL